MTNSRNSESTKDRRPALCKHPVRDCSSQGPMLLSRGFPSAHSPSPLSGGPSLLLTNHCLLFPTMCPGPVLCCGTEEPGHFSGCPQNTGPHLQVLHLYTRVHYGTSGGPTQRAALRGCSAKRYTGQWTLRKQCTCLSSSPRGATCPFLEGCCDLSCPKKMSKEENSWLCLYQRLGEQP